KIPLTYSVASQAPTSLLMTNQTAELKNVPADRALKLNVNGTGNYRVEYDGSSWNLLLGSLANLSVEDRINLLSDAWALVQANRAALSLYLGLVEKLPASIELAEREQVITVVDFKNRLLIGHPERAKFHGYARSLLRHSLHGRGWDPKARHP